MLELALKREVMGGVAGSDHAGGSPVVRAVVQEGPGKGKPAWEAEMTEIIRAVSLQSTQSSTHPHQGPCVWVV